LSSILSVFDICFPSTAGRSAEYAHWRASSSEASRGIENAARMAWAGIDRALSPARRYLEACKDAGAARIETERVPDGRGVILRIALLSACVSSKKRS